MMTVMYSETLKEKAPRARITHSLLINLHQKATALSAPEDEVQAHNNRFMDICQNALDEATTISEVEALINLADPRDPDEPIFPWMNRAKNKIAHLKAREAQQLLAEI